MATLTNYIGYFAAAIVVWVIPCFAFVVPSISQHPEAGIKSLSSVFIDFNDNVLEKAACSVTPTVLIATNDIVDQIQDSIQSFAMGLFIFLVLFNVVTASIKKYLDEVVLPQKVRSELLEMEQEDPENWAKIQAQLNEGETIEDRPDLVDELVERLKW